MDAKRIAVVFLAWLWQTTTTFAILLIAGMLGIALVAGLQGGAPLPPSEAPAIVVQRSAAVAERHPKLLVIR